MVDIEALDSGQNAAIISIGAVYFDIGEQALGEELYLEFDQSALREQIDLGATWSLSTTQWWMQQSDSAREVWARKIGQVSNKEGFAQLQKYFNLFPEHGRNLNVWGNGSTYDNVCMQNFYTRFNQQIPWNYTGDMCYRTIKAMFGHRVRLCRSGTYHNALDDSITQAKHLIAMLKEAL